MSAIQSIGPTRAVALFSWVIAVAAAWLAVGSQDLGQTVLIAAVGGLYLIFPPTGTLPKWILILFGLLLLLSATAFLPVSLVGASVHKPFLDHGIVLPSTLSPQPWLTLEDVTLLVATLLWAWSCFEFKLSYDQRGFLFTSYLVTLGVVAVVSIIRSTSLQTILPEWAANLGQFANRNQTGDLLVMGGVCAFARGIYDLSKRNFHGGFWILMTGVFLLATIRNGSRAALILFAFGLLLSFFLLYRGGRNHWLAPLIMGVVFLGGLFIFIYEGGALQERFQNLLGGAKEGRLAIYHDALAMVLSNPWCGVGLGNFEGVFNIERVYSALHPARCLHPESDWFWIAAELGVPGVIIVALIVGMTFRIYLGKTPYRSLTKICTAVAILFLIHGLFDVSGHRLGTVWSCLYLVSLGAFRPSSFACLRVPPLVLRVVGLGLLVIAGLRVEATNAQPWMPTQESVSKIKDTVVGTGPLKEQMPLINQALVWAPLDWSLYYQRARVYLQNPDSVDQANDDFNRALFLEQSTIELPTSVGEVCRYVDFPEALAAWQSIIQRAGTRRVELFESLCGAPDLDAKQHLAMMTLAGGDADLQAIGIIFANPSDFDWLLQNLLQADESLKAVSPDLRKRLFDHWVAVGNAQQFLEEWPTHPEWQAPGWRAYARALAAGGRFKEAVATAFQFLPAPATPDFHDQLNLDDAKLQYQNNPMDSFAGIRLYFAEVAAGLNDQAASTLVEVSKLPKPPAYIEYLLAKSLSATGQDEAAWQTLAPQVSEN